MPSPRPTSPDAANEEDILSCLDDEDNVVSTGAAGKVYKAVLFLLCQTPARAHTTRA